MSVFEKFPLKVTPKRFLEILVEIRKERSLTQKDIADMMGGYTQSFVSKLENNPDPGTITLGNLRSYFEAVTGATFLVDFVPKNTPNEDIEIIGEENEK